MWSTRPLLLSAHDYTTAMQLAIGNATRAHAALLSRTLSPPLAPQVRNTLCAYREGSGTRGVSIWGRRVRMGRMDGALGAPRRMALLLAFFPVACLK